MASDDERLTRLQARPLPGWWRAVGLGIFVHWTPASVPAFAPTGIELGALLQRKDRDALALVPYSEWYENSLRFPGSPVADHHGATYGDNCPAV
jgi:alpha-L-fucosidase